MKTVTPTFEKKALLALGRVYVPYKSFNPELIKEFESKLPLFFRDECFDYLQDVDDYSISIITETEIPLIHIWTSEELESDDGWFTSDRYYKFNFSPISGESYAPIAILFLDLIQKEQAYRDQIKEEEQKQKAIEAEEKRLQELLEKEQNDLLEYQRLKHKFEGVNPL